MTTLGTCLWFDDQAETDRCWKALLADGGQPGPCGRLKGRFGLS